MDTEEPKSRNRYRSIQRPTIYQPRKPKRGGPDKSDRETNPQRRPQNDDKEREIAEKIVKQLDLRHKTGDQALKEIADIGEKIEKKRRQRVTTGTAMAMTMTAIVFDVLQALFTLLDIVLPPLGSCIASLIGIYARLTFYVWTSAKGWGLTDSLAFKATFKKLTPVLTKIILPICKEIPWLEVIPAWTVSSILQLSFLKAEEELYNLTSGKVDAEKLAKYIDMLKLIA